MVREGYVEMHDSLDNRLCIYSYTEKCSADGAWNNETELCGGLVLENGSGMIYGRALPKIHEMTDRDIAEREGQTFLASECVAGDTILACRYMGSVYVATRAGFVDPSSEIKRFIGTSTWYVPDDETWCFVWSPLEHPVRNFDHELILTAKVNTLTGVDIDLTPRFDVGFGSDYNKQTKKIQSNTLSELEGEYIIRYSDGKRFKYARPTNTDVPEP